MKPQRMANCPPLNSCCNRCLASLLSFGMPAATERGGGAQPPLQPCASASGRDPIAPPVSDGDKTPPRQWWWQRRGLSWPALRLVRKWQLWIPFRSSAASAHAWCGRSARSPEGIVRRRGVGPASWGRWAKGSLSESECFFEGEGVTKL